MEKHKKKSTEFTCHLKIEIKVPNVKIQNKISVYKTKSLCVCVFLLKRFLVKFSNKQSVFNEHQW